MALAGAEAGERAGSVADRETSGPDGGLRFGRTRPTRRAVLENRDAPCRTRADAADVLR